jgi:hypothetical protein
MPLQERVKRVTTPVLYLPDSGAIAYLAGVNATAVDIAGAEHALRDPEQGHLIARNTDNEIVFLHNIGFRTVMYIMTFLFGIYSSRRVLGGHTVQDQANPLLHRMLPNDYNNFALTAFVSHSDRSSLDPLLLQGSWSYSTCL